MGSQSPPAVFAAKYVTGWKLGAALTTLSLSARSSAAPHAVMGTIFPIRIRNAVLSVRLPTRAELFGSEANTSFSFLHSRCSENGSPNHCLEFLLCYPTLTLAAGANVLSLLKVFLDPCLRNVSRPHMGPCGGTWIVGA